MLSCCPGTTQTGCPPESLFIRCMHSSPVVFLLSVLKDMSVAIPATQFVPTIGHINRTMAGPAAK